MKHFALFTMVAALLIASTSTADLTPPGLVRVTPRVRFTGVDKYPGHVFVVSLGTRTTPRATDASTQLRFEVKNTEPFALTGTQRFITSIHLLAIDRKDFEKRKAEDGTLAWLTLATPGVLSTTLSTPATFVKTKDKDTHVSEYNVAIADGKLTAEKAAEPKAKSSTELVPDERPLRPWMAAVAGAFSLALFGVWFARRRPSAL